MPGATFVGDYPGKKNVLGQAERRADLKVTDQHGRLVHLVWDTLGRCCVGKYLLFRAPWVPDISYLKVVANQSFPTGAEWDYAQLLADNRNAWERWFQDLRKFAAKMNGVSATEAYAAARAGRWAEVPKALLEECGVTELPEDIIKAAMAGNRWILGFSTVVPDWAGPWLALQEAQRVRASIPVTDAELERFRDVVETDLDDQFDPDALGGHRVPVRAAVAEKAPRPVTGKTRREVRLSGDLEE